MKADPRSPAPPRTPPPRRADAGHPGRRPWHAPAGERLARDPLARRAAESAARTQWEVTP